jgi:hypothetical protein
MRADGVLGAGQHRGAEGESGEQGNDAHEDSPFRLKDQYTETAGFL